MIGSTSFLTEEEIKSLGFKKYGDNLKISRFAHFYTPSTIEIGNNVRIDDFCTQVSDLDFKPFEHTL